MSTSRAIAPARPPIWVLVLAVSGANIGVSLLSPAVPLIRQGLVATACSDWFHGGTRHRPAHCRHPL